MATHPHKEEDKGVNVNNLYYLVGAAGGLFVGCILGCGAIWIPILGVFGVLFTGFFRNVFVKGRAGA
jgi:hypothetical protein